MGRWVYTWFIEYYEGQWINHKFIEAKTRTEAIQKLRATYEKVTEIVCCRRTERW